MNLKSLAITAGFVLVSAVGAAASAFWPGTVIGIPAWDSLNVRAWPATTSRVIDLYDLGDRVSLTGRCKSTSTGISFRIDGAGSTRWKYSRMASPYVWCQVLSPGDHIGWVRGKYVWPE